MASWFSKKKSEQVRGVEVSEDWNWASPEGFIVLDVETTGLSPKSNRLLEIALIQTSADGTPIAHWSTLINPQGPVGASEIHGITDKDVSGSPTFSDIADELIERLKGQALSAHNARFDLSFLRSEFARTGWLLPEIPTVCTLEASRVFLPDLTQRRLSDCAAALGLPSEQSHRALGDAAMAAGLLNYYVRRDAAEGSPLNLRTVPSQARSLSWPDGRGAPIQLSDGSSRPRKSNGRSMAPLDDELLRVLLGVTAEDLIGEAGSNAEIDYAELLLEVLEDGKLSDDEAIALNELAESFDMSTADTEAIHTRLLEFLAAEVWRDGSVSQAERRHLHSFAHLLGLPETFVTKVLAAGEEARNEKLSLRTKELPPEWSLGEPVRVGDRVVFTGCDAFDRNGLERKATKKGLRVTSSVSRKTNLLVSDGSVQGNKAKSAEEFGVRVVHPTEFVDLLSYIQPAVEGEVGKPASVETETLICRTCGKDFERIRVKGRKPVECPECRA